MAGPNYPRAFAHVGLTVPDLDRAVEWYQTVLGLELLMGPVELQADSTAVGRQVADVFGSETVRFRQAHLSTANGVALEVFEFLEPGTEAAADSYEYWKVGYSHICLVDRNIDELVRTIERSGGRIRTSGILDAFEGEPRRFCYCEDPFGNVIEIYTHSHEQMFANRQSY